MLWVVQEDVILMTGVSHVTHVMKDVVDNLAHGVETLVWVTMLLDHTVLVVSTVTVTTTIVLCQVVLHSSET